MPTSKIIMSTCTIKIKCNLFVSTCKIFMWTCKIIMSICNIIISTWNLFMLTCKITMSTCKIIILRREAVVKIFLPPFGYDFVSPPLCRYRLKVIFDDIIFLLSGNIIEYICFWCFNSIIMTWNKWLVFTKSVIMGLNNISPWPCPLCDVRLPCVITWLYSTPLLFMRAVGVVVCLSLRMSNVTGSRRTQYFVVSVIFYSYHCFVLFALFFTQWLIYPFFFHTDILI